MAHKRYDEVLNRILYDPTYVPEEFLIVYEHRGAPQGLKSLRVSEIVRATRKAVILPGGAQIPCHRIVQIRDRRTREILAGAELKLAEKAWRDIQEEDKSVSVFFTADHHFGHAKIIEYCNRPHASVEEMDRDLIARWNAVVGESDTVYHLGDFTLEGLGEAQNYFEQLNGSIHVLPGSHDRKWFGKQEYFSKSGHVIQHRPALLSLKLPIEESKHPLVVVLCHYAMRVWDRSHYGALHLYGHSHGRLPAEGRSMDVGVDVRREPFELEEIKVLLD